MIPKIIHYCWFGGQPKPKEVLNCINSWERVMPDFKIIEWNENNYDITKCKYMEDAYKEKKWAFVSDYCRLDVINTYGGIYLDTDVEVIKKLDSLLKEHLFCGFEGSAPKAEKFIAFGLGFGSEALHPSLCMMLKEYDKLNFYNSNGTLNLVNCPYIQTKILKEYGLKQNGMTQRFVDGIAFSEEYFCPKNYWTNQYNVTTKTFSIHHYSSYWNNPIERKIRKFILNHTNFSGIIAGKISRILSGSTIKYYYHLLVDSSRKLFQI